MALQKAYATQDNDGHWFIIPAHLATDFSKMLEEAEKTDHYDEFVEKFGVCVVRTQAEKVAVI